MNTGRVWETELNYSIEQQRDKVRKIFNDIGLEAAWGYLLDYYQVISPEYKTIIELSIKDKQSKEYHLDQFISGDVAVLLQPGTVRTGSELSKEISDKYPIHYGPITIFDLDGNPVETKDDFLVAKTYMIRLEKIGDSWSATSVPNRQHHGIISRLSALTKNALPYRNQAIRVAGETEVRLMMATMNPMVVVALLQLANNNDLCNIAIRTILESNNPAEIKELINYSKLGNYPSKSLEQVEHLMYCYGLEFGYIDESDHTYDVLESIGQFDITEFDSPDDEED